MMNFGALTAEIGSGVWGTSANFNGFRVSASLLHRLLSTEVNQTLHDVWPSPGLLQCVYIFGALAPERNSAMWQVQNSLCVQVLCCVLAALLHDTRAVGVSKTLQRGIFTRQGGHPIRHWAMELSSCFWIFRVYLSCKRQR